MIHMPRSETPLLLQLASKRWHGERAQFPETVSPVGTSRGGQRILGVSFAYSKTNQNAMRGGRGGIRTRDTVSRIHTFQACAFNRSATPPLSPIKTARARRIASRAARAQVAHSRWSRGQRRGHCGREARLGRGGNDGSNAVSGSVHRTACSRRRLRGGGDRRGALDRGGRLGADLDWSRALLALAQGA
jgi:hypothetical protein